MRVLEGQVHIAEIALIAVMSFLCLLIGYSLPLVGGLALVLWPLLVLHLAVSGVGIWIGQAIFRRRTAGRPAPPKRSGLARFLWIAPLITLTVGYGSYVAETGKWFL